MKKVNITSHKKRKKKNFIPRNKKFNKKGKYKLFKNFLLYLIISVIIIITIYRIFKSTVFLKKQEKDQQIQQEKQIKNKVFEVEKEHFFCCFCVMGKMENRYTRELITYYSSIGVEKFVIADNNLPSTEKFTDVVQDYINNKTVEVIDIRGKPYDHSEYFEIMYEKNSNRCDWLAFFDFDEYLVMHNHEGKNLTLQEYITNDRFGKCEAIQFNWVMTGDNDLVYYDNRPSIERFTKPNFEHNANRFVKVLARGGLNKAIFKAYESCHKPLKNITTCNSSGKIIENHSDVIIPPEVTNAYLLHFSTRTAEEYVTKVKRGHPGNIYLQYEERVELFFNLNKFTDEKLKVFEKYFNQTFKKYHHNQLY